MRGPAVLVALAGALPAAAQPPRPTGWTGERVINAVSYEKVVFGDQVNGRQEWFKFSGQWPSTVREERDGWLRIHDGTREGWARKSDFVRVEDAPAFFTRLVRADPDDSWNWFMRGAGWYCRGEYDNAIKDFDEALRLDPEYDAAFNSRGNCWLDKKDYERAVRDFTEAIRLDPAEAIYVHNRGLARFRRRDFDRAVRDYAEALRLDPGYANAFRNRGEAYLALKAYDRAAKDYAEAIRLDPNDPDGYTGRANLRLFTRDFDGAVKDYDEALRLNPKGTAFLRDKGVALWLAGKSGAAAEIRASVDPDGWKAEANGYRVVFGVLAARAAKDLRAADAFLADGRKLAPAWPTPAVRFLRGDLDATGLLKLAADDDQQTEARCYVAADLLHKDRPAEARPHLEWVRDHGTTTYIEYAIALAEPAKLDKGKD